MKRILFLIITTCQFSIAQTFFNISGGQVKVNGDVDLVLKDANWVNNGNFSSTNGTVHIKGTATSPNSSIEGNNTTSFHNLKIDKSANNAQLGQNISIQNQINLLNGNLDLKSFNIDISNGSFSASNNHYFITSGTGMLVQTIGAGMAKSFHVGNSSCTPLTIQNDGVADTYSVRTIPNVYDAGTSGNIFTSGVVNCTWLVDESVIGGSNLTLTASWNASDELPGFDRNNCAISHYTTSWDAPVGASASGGNPYSISRSGISSLSPFAVAGEGLLPVEIVYFRALRINEQSHLEWETSSEINTSHFDIEHSLDGFNFQKIGEKVAFGNSNSRQVYEFMHTEPSAGSNHYRLKINDFDGEHDYSEIKVLHFEDTGISLTIFPNPTTDFLNLRLSEPTENVELQLLSTSGQIVLEKKMNFTAFEQFSLGHLPKGKYWMKVILDGKVQTESIILQ